MERRPDYVLATATRAAPASLSKLAPSAWRAAKISKATMMMSQRGSPNGRCHDFIGRRSCLMGLGNRNLHSVSFSLTRLPRPEAKEPSPSRGLSPATEQFRCAAETAAIHVSSIRGRRTEGGTPRVTRSPRNCDRLRRKFSRNSPGVGPDHRKNSLPRKKSRTNMTDPWRKNPCP